jgi:hypothetical protein
MESLSIRRPWYEATCESIRPINLIEAATRGAPKINPVPIGSDKIISFRCTSEIFTPLCVARLYGDIRTENAS